MRNYDEQKQALNEIITSLKNKLYRYEPLKNALHLYAKYCYVNNHSWIDADCKTEINEAIASLFPNSNLSHAKNEMSEYIRVARDVFFDVELGIKELQESLASYDDPVYMKIIENGFLSLDTVTEEQKDQNFLETTKYFEDTKDKLLKRIMDLHIYIDRDVIKDVLGFDPMINQEIDDLIEKIECMNIYKDVDSWEAEANNVELDLIMDTIEAKHSDKEEFTKNCFELIGNELDKIYKSKQYSNESIASLLSAVKKMQDYTK